MTTTAAMAKVKAAKASDIAVNPDSLTFGAWSAMDAARALIACSSCEGAGDTFVFDGYITVTFHGGIIFITGIGRAP